MALPFFRKPTGPTPHAQLCHAGPPLVQNLCSYRLTLIASDPDRLRESTWVWCRVRWDRWILERFFWSRHVYRNLSLTNCHSKAHEDDTDVFEDAHTYLPLTFDLNTETFLISILFRKQTSIARYR